jgi:hypothetical protein
MAIACFFDIENKYCIVSKSECGFNVKMVIHGENAVNCRHSSQNGKFSEGEVSKLF